VPEDFYQLWLTVEEVVRAAGHRPEECADGPAGSQVDPRAAQALPAAHCRARLRRLFTARDSTARFLVADEVGLGKTLVARGIIAKAIDHLWDDVGRIDIVYICSNQSIARANLPKLRVGGEAERSFALATRLTLLATEMAPRPGTLASGRQQGEFHQLHPRHVLSDGPFGWAGQGTSRAVPPVRPLFRSRRLGLMNLLQGGVTRTQWWRDTLKNQPLPLDPASAGVSQPPCANCRTCAKRSARSSTSGSTGAARSGRAKLVCDATACSASCAGCWRTSASMRSSRT
jgi:hypothetical protein